MSVKMSSVSKTLSHVSFAGIAMVLVGANAQANHWNNLSDAEKTKLQQKCDKDPAESCQVIKETARTKSDEEKAKNAKDPIWPELTIYQLVDGTPEQAAATIYGYDLYGKMFAEAGVVSTKFDSGTFPNIAYEFVKKVKAGGLVDKNVNYTINIKWEKKNGEYLSTWTQKGNSPDIFWIAGGFSAEAIGPKKTLVSYSNYINPDGGALRFGLNSPFGRNQYKKESSTFVHLVKRWVETSPNKDLEAQVAAFNKLQF
jgi:hypothetical protein